MFKDSPPNPALDFPFSHRSPRHHTMLARFIALLAALHVVAFVVLGVVLDSPHLLIGAVVMALVLGLALTIGKGASRRKGPGR